eukprot:3117329-Prymnesium_polylepis.2
MESLADSDESRTVRCGRTDERGQQCVTVEDPNCARRAREICRLDCHASAIATNDSDSPTLFLDNPGQHCCFLAIQIRL